MTQQSTDITTIDYTALVAVLTESLKLGLDVEAAYKKVGENILGASYRPGPIASLEVIEVLDKALAEARLYAK